MLRAVLTVLLLGALASGRAIETERGQLPTVDLGYAIHQAVVNVGNPIIAGLQHNVLVVIRIADN